MNLVQVAGRGMKGLQKAEASFWEGLANTAFHDEWNFHRREFYVAAIQTLSAPQDAPVGQERTFRLLDRCICARSSLLLAAEVRGRDPIALGQIVFFLSGKEEQPFFTAFFDEGGHFGTSPFDLGPTDTAASLLGVFEQMAEAAMQDATVYKD